MSHSPVSKPGREVQSHYAVSWIGVAGNGKINNEKDSG
jgi:hypothetical protein